MCGICGYVSIKHLEEEHLKKMNNSITHRGPDDKGIETIRSGDYCIGLAHRRLSIIDLTEGGHQPMHYGDKVVVFNGEIYNHLELKEELVRNGFSFESTSDTEVLLAAYTYWGIDFLDKLNGMFAFALYDAKREILLLARDRIGKKPLYYWHMDNNFVFASELKPIMLYPGFPKNIRPEILSRFLHHMYIASPDTIFENVYKLEPGHYLIWKDNEINSYCYWNILSKYKELSVNKITSYAQAKDELTNIIESAVKRRMISDVPIGALLSGGIDSTIVSAYARKHSTSKIKTFSIGFYEKEKNEAPFAKKISEYLETDHTEYYVDEKMMLNVIDSIPLYYDEPFADSSQIPTMLVSEIARKQVTVALSGDGGDEFFCGYPRYHYASIAQKLAPFGKAIYSVLNLPGIRSTNLIQHLPFKVQSIVLNNDPNSETQLGTERNIKIINRLTKNSFSIKYEFENELGIHDWRIRRMMLDMLCYLPDDILCKVDRASMKYSLETRCPMLDREIMEYSFRLPIEFKNKDGVLKSILKDIAFDLVPRQLLERPKSGFCIPQEKWIRTVLKERVEAFSDVKVLKQQGLFQTDETSSFIEYFMKNGDIGRLSGGLYSNIVWAFLMFQMWYNEHIENIV